MARPLLNARHERFAQELAKGASQVEAYRRAGYVPNESHASRLVATGKVSARVEELKASAAERVVATIHDISDQLDEDRAFARLCEAPSAMVSASMGKAKLLGYLSDRVEHTGRDGGPIEVADLSPEEAARRIAFTLSKADRNRTRTLS